MSLTSGVGNDAANRGGYGLAASVGLRPAFLLDLRKAPSDAAAWLNEERSIEDGFSVQAGRGFDILFYVDSVAPACSP